MTTNYVMCATLHDVPDVFNVENLWERARRGQQGEFLMDALIQHPRTRRSRNRAETYFHQVIVRIPKADYDHDERAEDGFNREELIQDLIKVHTKKLGRYVPEGQAVRYRVEMDPALPSKQVRFLFGRAIYLPDPRERPIYRLSHQNGVEIRELGVVYPGQRLTLLNDDPYASTFSVRDWPFPASESVLLIVKPNQAPAVCAEPDGSLTVQPECERVFLISNPRGISLRLRVEPLAAANLTQGVEAPTWTPGMEPSHSMPRLRVIGVALPRLSLHAKTGLRGWRLGFDQHGVLVRCQAPNAVAWLRIDSEDQLWGETEGDSTRLAPPTVWRPRADLALELGTAPGVMGEHYCAWVRLSQPVPLPAPVGRWFGFGRGADAELNPGLLNDPDALVGDATQSVQPEQLMLSRRHLGLRLEASGWMAKLESTTWPVYRLSQAGELDQVLSVEDRSREWAIAPGAWLMVGGYMLELGEPRP